MHSTDGHLTALGWTSLVLYLMAALLSCRAATLSRSHDSYRPGRIWAWLAVILAALGINKQLDLQTLLIKLCRHIATREALNTYRVALHVLFFAAFVVAVVALSLWVMLAAAGEVRKFGRRQPLAAVGCGLICGYVVIRAASIDGVDKMLGLNLEQIPFLWLLEAGGLMLIMFQALLPQPAAR